MQTNNLDIATALSLYDKVEANLVKLERIWSRFEPLLDELTGIDPPELVALLDRWGELSKSLPSIDGFSFEAQPVLPSVATQWQLDAREIGFREALFDYYEAINEPGNQLAVYRSRMEQARRRIIRQPVLDTIDDIDSILESVVVGTDSTPPQATWKNRTRWPDLSERVDKLRRLVGRHIPGEARWADLIRHLHFAEPWDLFDILSRDWPSVKSELIESLHGEWEPIPVEVEDLGSIFPSEVQSPVGTKLDWSRLTTDQFEGIVLELFRAAEGYENENWLMRTNAPDRGRDIEAYRVIGDVLSKTRRLRIIVQCKHWLSRSVGRGEVIQCIESVRLWEPPRVDVLIMVTSGRFSQDTVAQAEKRETDGHTPLVELWSDSHLEGLLARYPHIAAAYGLR